MRVWVRLWEYRQWVAEYCFAYGFDCVHCPIILAEYEEDFIQDLRCAVLRQECHCRPIGTYSYATGEETIQPTVSELYVPIQFISLTEYDNITGQ